MTEKSKGKIDPEVERLLRELQPTYDAIPEMFWKVVAQGRVAMLVPFRIALAIHRGNCARRASTIINPHIIGETTMDNRNFKETMLDEYLKIAARACKLESWTELVTPINCPSDLLPALSSGRAELIAALPPRDLSADEAKVLYDVITALINTNTALKTHTEQVARLTTVWASSFNQLRSLGYRIEKYAYFKHSEAELGDDDD